MHLNAGVNPQNDHFLYVQNKTHSQKGLNSNVLVSCNFVSADVNQNTATRDLCLVISTKLLSTELLTFMRRLLRGKLLKCCHVHLL